MCPPRDVMRVPPPSSSSSSSLRGRDLEDSFPVDYRDGIKTCDAATQCAANETDYCLLTCDKFNSVFFCDRNHPQDIFVSDKPGEDSKSTYNVMAGCSVVHSLCQHRSHRSVFL